MKYRTFSLKKYVSPPYCIRDSKDPLNRLGGHGNLNGDYPKR
jgi:hypothetical protein